MKDKATYLVRIDQETYAFLKSKAIPFESRGKLIRRLLGIDIKKDSKEKRP